MIEERLYSPLDHEQESLVREVGFGPFIGHIVHRRRAAGARAVAVVATIHVLRRDPPVTGKPRRLGG